MANFIVFAKVYNRNRRSRNRNVQRYDKFWIRSDRKSEQIITSEFDASGRRTSAVVEIPRQNWDFTSKIPERRNLLVPAGDGAETEKFPSQDALFDDGILKIRLAPNSAALDFPALQKNRKSRYNKNFEIVEFDKIRDYP